MAAEADSQTVQGPAAAAEEAAGAIAAPNPVLGISPRAVLGAATQWASTLAFHPDVVARETIRLAADTGRLLAGWNAEDPATDRRFRHRAFTRQPYRFVAQEYLAWRATLYRMVDRASVGEFTAERARFAVGLVAETLAPTNVLVGNPAALERAWTTRGRSLTTGARHLLDDLRHNGAMPAVARPGILSVGSDLAVTPGAVVHRHPMYELIQYSPQTKRVRAVPLLVVASPINKYYFLDLAPGRSLIEYAVRRGIQCFAISWRNPTAAQRDWTLASYADAVDDASRVIAAISRSDDTNVVGVCAGGSITAAWLGARAAHQETRTPATTMLVAGIDTSWPSLFGALATRGTIAASLRRARRNGVFGGRDISRTFAWSRPNELVWNLWVHNYLLGHEPPTTDILAWNADLTNLPAGLHADLIRILADNSFTEPGRVALGRTPVDLAKIDSDVYVLGALADHIVPWQACYRSARLFAGRTRFVAASGGHIQSLVNPPGNPRSRYRTGADDLNDDPELWMRNATEHAGTWWDDWLDWLETRSGATKAAPTRLGARSHPALAPAPGRYVHQRAAA